MGALLAGLPAFSVRACPAPLSGASFRAPACVCACVGGAGVEGLGVVAGVLFGSPLFASFMVGA